jgi:hypothetical protein
MDMHQLIKEKYFCRSLFEKRLHDEGSLTLDLENTNFEWQLRQNSITPAIYDLPGLPTLTDKKLKVSTFSSGDHD